MTKFEAIEQLLLDVNTAHVDDVGNPTQFQGCATSAMALVVAPLPLA